MKLILPSGYQFEGNAEELKFLRQTKPELFVNIQYKEIEQRKFSLSDDFFAISSDFEAILNENKNAINSMHELVSNFAGNINSLPSWVKREYDVVIENENKICNKLKLTLQSFIDKNQELLLLYETALERFETLENDLTPKEISLWMNELKLIENYLIIWGSKLQTFTEEYQKIIDAKSLESPLVFNLELLSKLTANKLQQFQIEIVNLPGKTTVATIYFDITKSHLMMRSYIEGMFMCDLESNRTWFVRNGDCQERLNIDNSQKFYILKKQIFEFLKHYNNSYSWVKEYNNKYELCNVDELPRIITHNERAYVIGFCVETDNGIEFYKKEIEEFDNDSFAETIFGKESPLYRILVDESIMTLDSYQKLLLSNKSSAEDDYI